MKWKVIDTGSASPEANMAFDKKLLESASESQEALLHLYEWEGLSATYGYFTDPDAFFDAEEVEKSGLQLARRPTGGGIIFHIHDLAFSAVVPASHPRFSLNTLDNYAYINQAVIKAVAVFAGDAIVPELHRECGGSCSGPVNMFCMAKPTQYDVMVMGKKVGGAAQRRTREGFLHQGSISLALPPLSLLRQVLKAKETIIEAMTLNSFCLLPDSFTPGQLEEARGELKKGLIAALAGGCE